MGVSVFVWAWVCVLTAETQETLSCAKAFNSRYLEQDLIIILPSPFIDH